MSARTLQCLSIVAAVSLAACCPTVANAQCCGGATTAYYQPAAYTAYSPVVYQSYYSGWYPGYFFDRIRARLWGAPSTYVAAYPTTYTAAYPTSYAASYPAYTTSYAASYAPVSSAPVCSTCTANYSPCATCATVQQVSLRPVGSCDPCSTCATCSSYSVSQTSYEAPGGCAACGGSANIVESTNTGGMAGPQPAATPNGTSQPTIDPGQSVPESRLKQINGSDPPVTPAPPAGNTQPPAETAPASDGNNAQYFEAPELFNPKDRTAQRGIAPVRTALYEQPVGYQQVSVPSTSRITAEQARRDAAGWTSATN